ncbi:hypothetical protein [Endozoicomonas ascidiicola]|uniref:PglD-related sugar-binding protein n=1 Tax=Endozoicomonas ascidiicola TaxID=1698521 RepID=UPI000831B2CE|nr:hypothetical protein [Endozoicomonas ascidiicola]
MPTEILIIGAGGYAKVVVEACRLSSQEIKIVIAVQSTDKVGLVLLGKHPAECLNAVSKQPRHFHVGIGSNSARKKLSSLITGINVSLTSVIHSIATLSLSAKICAGAVILPMIRIGKDSVIGARAVITSDVPAGKTVAGVPGIEI